MSNRLPFTQAADYLAILLLFCLAFLPRAYDLDRFVTADEAKWVSRSAQFLTACLTHEFANTNVNLTPAVTTTWLGSFGLVIYYAQHQATLDQPLTEWLTTLPPFRPPLDVLVATRWPMVWFSSLSVLLIYLLARRLFDPGLAFIGSAFIALDPHPISLDRLIGHDAPTAIFTMLTLLLLLRYLYGCQVGRVDRIKRRTEVHPTGGWLMLAGITAGLAFLSKAPALFLIPFTGLMLFVSQAYRHRTINLTLRYTLMDFFRWLLTAYLTFIIIWPAAWLEPLGAPQAVLYNAFSSATDTEEADEEGYWLVPNLGPAYYLVNGAFKLSPLVLVGLALAVVIWGHRFRAGQLSTMTISIGWLLAFAMLFTIFVTLSEKRSPRYLLPIFGPLAFVAAYGWQGLVNQFLRPAYPRWGQPGFVASLIVAGLIILWPYAPYYLSYYNPLLGGSVTAPRMVKIGWGEGLDHVGRYLARVQPDSRVGTAYASTVAPYFPGDLAGLTSDHLDFLVLYRKQIQAGQPSPTFIRYYQQLGPVFTVDINGIRYAELYAGPSLIAPTTTPQSQYTQPLVAAAYRPLTPYGRLGESLTVDIIWFAASNRSATWPPVTLQLLTPAGSIIATGSSQPTVWAEGLIVSRHELAVPADLTRGMYPLQLADPINRPLGEVELRQFQMPPDLASPGGEKGVIFGKQIALVGYQFTPTEDYISLTLAWQAHRARLPDYTVFAQLLTGDTGERLAGTDSPPVQGNWPTSRWVKGEVVMDTVTIAVPPDLPTGYYELIVGLYQPHNGQRLPTNQGRDYWSIPWTFIWEPKTN